MPKPRVIAGTLGGLTLLLLLVGSLLFWALSDPAPRPQVGYAPTGETPNAATVDPPVQNSDVTPPDDNSGPLRNAEVRTNTPGVQPAPAPEVDPDTYLPPPPVMQERPPMEGEEGESIPPAHRQEDLSGQALMVHRDLELTLRVLHDLTR